MNPYYKDYSQYLSEKFGAQKVQKLSVNAGFSCPNRDGTISRGGCAYCNVRSFTPGYCDSALSVAQQLKEGKQFFSRKYPMMKYLAYFQSFTGTHGMAISGLRELYTEAISQPDIVGLIIGTRPDCLPAAVMDLLEEFNRRLPVIVEIGAETSHGSTLELINRGHTWKDVEDSVIDLPRRGIDVGLHLIAGLPGESEQDLMTTIDKTLKLPVSTLKLHQLQIVRGTPLAKAYEGGAVYRGKEVQVLEMTEYLDICVRIVRRIMASRPDIALERFVSSAPAGMVIAPGWGLKNHEFVNLLHKKLKCLTSEVR